MLLLIFHVGSIGCAECWKLCWEAEMVEWMMMDDGWEWVMGDVSVNDVIRYCIRNDVHVEQEDDDDGGDDHGDHHGDDGDDDWWLMIDDWWLMVDDDVDDDDDTWWHQVGYQSHGVCEWGWKVYKLSALYERGIVCVVSRCFHGNLCVRPVDEPEFELVGVTRVQAGVVFDQASSWLAMECKRFMYKHLFWCLH